MAQTARVTTNSVSRHQPPVRGVQTNDSIDATSSLVTTFVSSVSRPSTSKNTNNKLTNTTTMPKRLVTEAAEKIDDATEMSMLLVHEQDTDGTTSRKKTSK